MRLVFLKDKAMTQEHAFLAARLCLEAEARAAKVK